MSLPRSNPMGRLLATLILVMCIMSAVSLFLYLVDEFLREVEQ